MQAPLEQSIPETKGWVTIAKENMSPSAIKEKLTQNSSTIIEGAGYLVGGFFVGFLFKKYGRIFILYAAIFAAILYFLNYMDVISFDFLKMKEIVGISPQDSVNSLLQNSMLWLREHVVHAVIAVIGFMIGYNLG